jgi:hypothetical protein
MVTPTLVVAGDKDDSQHWMTMGPDWHADPYHLAPGPRTLLTVLGGGHLLLGGIQGRCRMFRRACRLLVRRRC